MFKKLLKNKLRAFAKATSALDDLKVNYQAYIKNTLGDNIDSKFIGLNAFDATKFIFEDSNYYEYVKYAQLSKKYENKMSSIKSTIIILFILIGVIPFIFIRPIWIPIVIAVILLIILIKILKKLKSGESYDSFYKRTFRKFLFGIYPGITFSEGFGSSMSKSEIINITGRGYDEKVVISNMNFSGGMTKGNICDLELYDITEIRDKDGDTTEVRTKVFDGFCLKIQTSQKHNLLKGNIIRIKADENIFSHLAEDTVRGIHENEREIGFNSEEMTKSFDARISGYKGFSSVDDALIAAKRIITPSFESHLLYLRSRYNTFSMNISDGGIEMSINMTRNLLQQVKHKELFDFKTTYREANEQFKMIHGDLLGISDFAYYKVFPFLERLYLINYLTYLYLSYIDFENYYDINNHAINDFEEKMKSIYTMEHKDFRKLYLDKIEQIKEETNSFALVFEKEEK